MFDPTTFKRKRITLDWDFSQFDELEKRVRFIHDNYDDNLNMVSVFLSSLKGFHVELWFKNPVLVAKIRNELKDDGIRLVKDILRSHNIHDVLWHEKIKHGSVFRQRLILCHKK